MVSRKGVNMVRVEAQHYNQVAPFFRDVAEFHLSIDAVCHGTAPGEVFVDALDQPSVGFVKTPEGEYLVGDAACERAYPALQALIPEQAYLTFHPASWEPVLPQIWTNPVARRHPRLHLRWQRPRARDWRASLPEGFEVVAIDAELLARTDLRNHEEITDRMLGWLSTDFFLKHGFGFCVIGDDTIVSRCVADCVLEDKCEIGVGTDPHYRHRGMAFAAVAATIEHCLSRGFTHIGWHCLRSNAGSRALAEKAGFGIVAEYSAYSAVLPAENPTDLTTDEYADWAVHYEKHAATNAWYRLFAVEAWTLAGERDRALGQLHLLVNGNWHGSASGLSRRWALQSLQALPEYRSIVAVMRSESER